MFDLPQQFIFNPSSPHNHIYSFDKNHMMRGCNDIQAFDVGFSSVNEIYGKHLDDLYSKEETTMYIENNEEILRTGDAKLFDEFAKLDDGGIIFYSSYKYPLKNEKNKIIGVMGITVPIEHVSSPAAKHVKLVVPDELKCLSPRQLKCFYLILKGGTSKSIARELHLSHRTIEHYLAHIRLKLKCKNLRELIGRYANCFDSEEQGIVPR